ncbi:glycosyltransferase [Marseilla massiliensis]|uniref:Glycosyltransferase family 2 protein n=1 Tax=Marseilla massiliensis TaxID=1841864 RepID=A0A938WQ41_9BACT|nr:glycosyltransferase [Marseilla massiliensis]MBM6662073.1 glycosyltransferase family 2 protein [Marseilla massiliensis]
MEKLAIIIPAYKDIYLFKTLLSIARQSNTDFNLYICNDNSPYDIEKVLFMFRNETNMGYKYIKFEENLGSQNLVKHWKRCVDQTHGEEWIWLFSDDDMMEPNCVQDFYNTINTKIKNDILHFDLTIINSDDNVRSVCRNYSQNMRAETFFSQLCSGQIDARMPEFILRRKKFEEIGGYVEFDLAWRSDNATVIAMSNPFGVRTIQGSRVLWRYSSDNISGKKANIVISHRKDESTIKFFNWVDEYFKENKLNYQLSKLRLIRSYTISLSLLSHTFNIGRLWKLSDRFKGLKSVSDRLMFIAISCYMNIKNLLKSKF